LSWQDTFKEMAREREDWSDLDVTVADGLGPEGKWWLSGTASTLFSA
jgi:hypothetical protein